MEGALQFLQTYGLWIALGGGLLYLMTRGGGMGGCCGLPQQRGAGQSQDSAGAGCRQAPAKQAGSGPAERATTTTELQARLDELRARQDGLARQIAALESDSAGAEVSPRESVGSAQARSGNQGR